MPRRAAAWPRGADAPRRGRGRRLCATAASDWTCPATDTPGFFRATEGHFDLCSISAPPYNRSISDPPPVALLAEPADDWGAMAVTMKVKRAELSHLLATSVSLPWREIVQPGATNTPESLFPSSPVSQ